MKKADYIIIDFDSTFISKESLDMLAEACLKKHKNRHKIIKQVQTITDQGMSGKIDFRDSLDKRIKLIKATKNDVDAAGALNSQCWVMLDVVVVVVVGVVVVVVVVVSVLGEKS